ncbi:MAG: hypothetical protein AABY22_24715 [Nanoarchaeota archaeon]
MQTPNTIAGKVTEEIMLKIKTHLKGGVSNYNQTFTKVLNTLEENYEIITEEDVKKFWH